MGNSKAKAIEAWNKAGKPTLESAKAKHIRCREQFGLQLQERGKAVVNTALHRRFSQAALVALGARLAIENNLA